VDVERSPFALAARATALVLVGDRRGALADVERQAAIASATYWDRAVAQVAAAAAGDAVELDALLDAASVPDVVLSGSVAAVAAGLAGDPGPDLEGSIGQWAGLAGRVCAAARS